MLEGGELIGERLPKSIDGPFLAVLTFVAFAKRARPRARSFHLRAHI